MKKILWIVFFSLFLNTGQLFALEVMSLAPVRGTPGTLVAVSGGPFSPETQVFLGEQYIAPLQSLENILEFSIPYLPPGKYILSVQDNGIPAQQTYQFEVMAPAPQLTKIYPSTLDICTINKEYQIQVNGRNFLPGAVLLVNGNTVPSQTLSSTNLEAQLPGIQQPGVYGISVRNPDGAASLPQSLWVNSIPGINSVERGTDFVNYYEVIIHGKNFLFNSTLVVREPQDKTIGQAYSQLSFVPRNSSTSQTGDNIVAPQKNRLIFVDCQTLVYHRYPSNFQSKELGLRVLNPDGHTTAQHYVTLP